MSGLPLKSYDMRHVLRRTLRRILVAGSSVMLIGITSLKQEVTAAQNASAFGFVRFAHTAIDVGPIDIYRGSSQAPLITNLDYGQSTDFISLPASPVGYVARLAGSGPEGAILFKLDWGLRSSTSDMIIASGLNAQKAFILEPLTIVRNNTQGKARVRVFNTVWGGPTLTVRSGQGMVFGQDLQYLKLADSDVEPGLYDFEVSNGSGQDVATQMGVALEANKVYVMLIVGGKDRNPPIKILMIASDQETTRVRFANKTSKAGDIYLKRMTDPFITNLVADGLTNYLAVPSGATTFVVRDAGSSAYNTVIASLVTQLYPGHDVTVTLNGPDKAIQMTLTDDGLTAATPVPAVLSNGPISGLF